MDKQSPDDAAARKAAEHHSKASELFREFRRDGDDALVGRANAEVARADEWEQSAPQEPGFERDGEADPSTSRRTWYKQGSVGDEPLQQFQEAEQDGSLFAQLLNYSARAVADKEHRTFEGARLAGKAATAPVRSAVAVGKTAGRTAHAAGKGVRRTGQAAGKVAAASAGKAAGAVAAPAKSAARGGRAILNAVRRHKTGVPGAGDRAPRQQEQKGVERGAEKSAARSGRRLADRSTTRNARSVKPQAKTKAKTRGRDRDREPER